MKDIKYYTHSCLCGCGGQIEIKKHHSWYGAPEYIKGHQFKGKHHSEEVRQYISKFKKGKDNGRKGKKNTEEHKQNIAKALKGKNKSEEHKRNLSKIRKELWSNLEYRENQLKNNFFKNGKEHPFWNEGSSFEIYPKEFNKKLKQFIKDRDLNICQTPNCMNTDCLDVHHIDYNKQNNNPENLTTLCRNCHSKTNYNRNYFTEFYTNIITLYL